jgi:uncharacterized protein (DUF488 family)
VTKIYTISRAAPVLFTVFTIGYATIPVDEFISILQKYEITYLIDIRSVPFSRFYPQYNYKTLANKLAEVNIKYENLKNEFGARQENDEWFTDGYLDYEKFAKSQQFQQGVKHTLDLANNGEIVCLMCAEKDPTMCHRAILCGKELYKGVARVSGERSENRKDKMEVLHIRYDNGRIWIETHAELEQRINGDYAKQNAKIGYRK